MEKNECWQVGRVQFVKGRMACLTGLQACSLGTRLLEQVWGEA